MECPKCGSIELCKKGTRAGKQRYQCKSCKASFTEGVTYTPALKRPPVNKICPKCGSTHIQRHGQNQYRCASCGVRFAESTQPEKFMKKRWLCPYCGKPLRNQGYGKLGQPDYFCKNCNRSCSGDKETGKPIFRKTFKELNKYLKCPHCDSLNLRKAGFAKGKFRFYCNDCKKSFGVLSKKEKDKLENQIVFYGAHLNVPISYLSSHFHCTKQYCTSIINSYKKSVIPLTS